MEYLIGTAGVIWLVFLAAPWRPWSTKERLEPDHVEGTLDHSDLTVIIPARNEAAGIRRTLLALADQGANLRIILVDDQSADETARVARATPVDGLRIIEGKPVPPAWTGKLWALEQGLRTVTTDLALLLDADIELGRGVVGALKQKLNDARVDLVSVMAWLRMESFWERLLAPAFIYFFKLLYPFSIGNDPHSRLGVAAGGCVLVRTDALRKAGAFLSIRSSIIDDCALASRVKACGGHTWIGLSHTVRSHRPYPRLADFWQMVERTAFTQLRYSVWLLLGTTLVMSGMYVVPWVSLFLGSTVARGFGLIAVSGMMASYVPTLLYYRRSILWAPTLPVIGALYLLMTWSSAIRYWRRRATEWKGRAIRPETAEGNR
jgi:hopene-associated glycosyltransferase HpnB